MDEWESFKVALERQLPRAPLPPWLLYGTGSSGWLSDLSFLGSELSSHGSGGGEGCGSAEDGGSAAGRGARSGWRAVVQVEGESSGASTRGYFVEEAGEGGSGRKEDEGVEEGEEEDLGRGGGKEWMGGEWELRVEFLSSLIKRTEEKVAQLEESVVEEQKRLTLLEQEVGLERVYEQHIQSRIQELDQKRIAIIGLIEGRRSHLKEKISLSGV